MMPGRMRLRHALLSALMLLIAIASLPRGLALAKLDSRVGSCGANEVERIVHDRVLATAGARSIRLGAVDWSAALNEGPSLGARRAPGRTSVRLQPRPWQR